MKMESCCDILFCVLEHENDILGFECREFCNIKYLSFTSFTPVFCILIGKCHFTTKAFLLTFNTAGSVSSAIIRMGCGVLEEVSMCTCINWDIKDVKSRGART